MRVRCRRLHLGGRLFLFFFVPGPVAFALMLLIGFGLSLPEVLRVLRGGSPAFPFSMVTGVGALVASWAWILRRVAMREFRGPDWAANREAWLHGADPGWEPAPDPETREVPRSPERPSGQTEGIVSGDEPAAEVAVCRHCEAPLSMGFGLRGHACAYCGAVDCADPALVARIEAWRQKLLQASEDMRQMPQRLVRALEAADDGFEEFGAGAVMLSLVVLLVVPRLAEGARDAASWFRDGIAPSPLQAWLALLPWMVLAALVLWALVHRAGIERLRRTFGALPPVSSGEPARCRLCGGDLPGEGVLRRCGWCGADSVVSQVRFARWRDDLERALTTWSAEAEVRQVRSARRMLRWELVVLVVWLAFLALFPVVVLQEPAALLRLDAVVVLFPVAIGVRSMIPSRAEK